MKKLLGLSLSMALLALAVSPALAKAPDAVSGTSPAVTVGVLDTDTLTMTNTLGAGTVDEGNGVFDFTYEFKSNGPSVEDVVPTTGSIVVLDMTDDALGEDGHHVTVEIVATDHDADATTADVAFLAAADDVNGDGSALDEGRSFTDTDVYQDDTGVVQLRLTADDGNSSIDLQADQHASCTTPGHANEADADTITASSSLAIGDTPDVIARNTNTCESEITYEYTESGLTADNLANTTYGATLLFTLIDGQ